MLRRVRLASFAIATLTVPTAACTMPGGSAGGPPGGSITVSNYVYSGSPYPSASAFFIARLDTSNGSTIDAWTDAWSLDLAMDECAIVLPPEEEEPVPTAIGLDVGPTVTLETGVGSEEITLNPQGLGSYTSYDFAPASGKDYTVVIEGTEEVEGATWEDALHLPEELDIDELASGSIVLSDSAKTDLTWNAIGAEFVLLTFPASAQGGVGYCKVDDDGTFGIPAEIASGIDTSGYLTAAGVSSSKESLAGRSVQLVGVSGQQAYYSVGAVTPAAN